MPKQSSSPDKFHIAHDILAIIRGSRVVKTRDEDKETYIPCGYLYHSILDIQTELKKYNLDEIKHGADFLCSNHHAEQTQTKDLRETRIKCLEAGDHAFGENYYLHQAIFKQAEQKEAWRKVNWVWVIIISASVGAIVSLLIKRL